MNFSQRAGLEPSHTPLLTESMSKDLLISLWNIILGRLFGKLGSNAYGEITQEYNVFIALWKHFFKQPMDEFERLLGARKDWYRDAYDTMEWNRVYDFLEFIAGRMLPYDAAIFTADVNEALAAEYAAYRFAGNKIVCMSDTKSAETLGLAQDEAARHDLGQSGLALVACIKALGQRENPDFDLALVHSKEALRSALSHVENLCGAQALVAGQTKLEGNDVASAFVESEKSEKLVQSVKSLQAVTETMRLLSGPTPESSEVLLLARANRIGLPEGLLDKIISHEGAASRDEAECCVVTCSALIRYLVARATGAGLIPAVPAKNLKPANPDPWGERK